MLKTSLTAAVAALALTLGSPAQAETSEEVLALADSAMNRANDQIIEWKVVNKVPGKADANDMAFISSVMGEKSIIEFSAPGDLKGTKVLVLSRTQMYIYLPEYRKIRRVASHTTQQGFMGTCYSNDDMSMTRFGDVFDGKLLSEDDATWTLELTPKADSDAPYARGVIVLDKKMHHPLKLQWFNDKGANVKTEVRKDYACQDNVCLAGSMKMTDLTRKGAWSELIRTGWELNTGLTKADFSVRVLQSGN